MRNSFRGFRNWTAMLLAVCLLLSSVPLTPVRAENTEAAGVQSSAANDNVLTEVSESVGLEEQGDSQERKQGSWKSKYLDFSIWANSLLGASFEETTVSNVTDGLEVLEAFRIKNILGRLLSRFTLKFSLFSDSVKDLKGKLKLYGITNGKLTDSPILESIQTNGLISTILQGMDGFALVLDSGLRKIEALADKACEQVKLSGLLPEKATI